jgi:hypothetical protein
MVSFFLLNLDILPYGGSDNSPAAPPATRLTHGVEVARFFKHTFFAAWHSFDTSTAASLATRLTHGVEVARFSTQSSAALSQHRHAPSDVLQRPRPTIGVKNSPLLALILQPQSDFNIPTAAFSATTNDARRENGSLLFKPNSSGVLLRHIFDSSRVVPPATTTDERRERQPAPLLFFHQQEVSQQLSRFDTLPKLPIEIHSGKRMHNDQHQVRPAMPFTTETAEDDTDTPAHQKNVAGYTTRHRSQTKVARASQHTPDQNQNDEARNSGSRGPHTNIADTTTTIRKTLYGAAVLKTAPGRKHQPSLHLKPPMASPKARGGRQTAGVY